MRTQAVLSVRCRRTPRYFHFVERFVRARRKNPPFSHGVEKKLGFAFIVGGMDANTFGVPISFHGMVSQRFRPVGNSKKKPRRGKFGR